MTSMGFEHSLLDVQLAWRAWRRSKAFAVTALLTMTVGIAGAAIMFALVEGVLLRPLPVRDQDRLLVVWKELRSAGFAHYPFRSDEVDLLSRESRLLEAVAAVDYNGAQPMVAVEDSATTLIQGASVMGDFFGALGVEPLLGRPLTPADDVIGAENVVVISDGLWQRRYGAGEVVGRTIELRERHFRIVGVMPPGFSYPLGADLWITTAGLRATVTDPAFTPLVDIVARMRAGVTAEAVKGELQAMMPRLEKGAPVGETRGLTPVVRTYEDVVVGEVRPALLVLLGAVALVLLIACANVANLLLLRGEARRRDIAVRTALGASRRRLAGQVLAESSLLAVAAGAAALLVTWWSLPVVLAWMPVNLPRADTIGVDARVIAFTIAVAWGTALLAGVAPVVASTRVDLLSLVRGIGRGTSRPSRDGRPTLVVVQVALAITVMAAAGLLTRSVLKLEALDMGLAADRLVFVELALPRAKYAERERQLQFQNDVMAALEGAPGIVAATPVNTPPFAGTGGWDAPTFTAEGQGVERAASNPSLNLESIHANYFATFGVALVRGRAFTSADRDGAPNVAIVSEDVAARTWPGEDAIGKRIKLGGPSSSQPWRTVVAVARPTRYRELRDPRPTLYLPATQFMMSPHAIVLRTTSTAAAVAGVARHRISTVDPDVRAVRFAHFAEHLDGPLARPRFSAALTAAFAAAAMFLAAIGLYALMGAYVRQRETEIGIRVALGATTADVRGLILGQGLRLVAMGAVVGLAGTLATTRLLRGLLFDVHPLDPVSMLAVALVVAGAAVLALSLPARRAAAVDPMVLLKAD